MKLRPAADRNRPGKPVLTGLQPPKGARVALQARSYLHLVTRHGVPPETARKLLGL